MLGPLLILLVALLPNVSLAAGVVRIEPRTSVEGTAITLGEIALLDGFASEVEARLRALSLGDAASPGRQRVLGGAGLRQRIAEIAPDALLEVPDEVHVHSAYREITPEYVRARLEQALRHVMPWPDDAVTLSGWRLPPTFAVPPHARRFLVQFRSDEGFLGTVTAQVEAIDPQEPDHTRVVRSAGVVVEVKLPVLVTTRALRRGEVVSSDAVRLETRDLRALPRNVLLQPEAAIGHPLARSLQENVPVLQSYLEAERLVKRGDVLDVRAEQGGLELRLDARALQHGVLGETIRAENPATRRRFVVEITGPGRARLGSGSGVGAR